MYFKRLEKRSKESHAYKKFQLVGLQIAEILGDRPHKALYIKLAKERDGDELLRLAKSVAEKGEVARKGAYFMAILAKPKNAVAEHYKPRNIIKVSRKAHDRRKNLDNRK